MSELSWQTKITRTRIVTEKGLSASSNASLQSLGDVHRIVQKLRLTKYEYNDLEESAIIGEGESFLVKRCTYRGGTIAVKHIKTQTTEGDEGKFQRRLATILLEISIMHHAPLRHHPNILALLGYGWTTSGESLLPYMVVEYGMHGSLRSYMKDHIDLPLLSKVILAGDVAAGLMALHTCQIIHGDLKLDNVVVFTSWDRPSGTIAKICDYGHSILPFADGGKKPRYYGTPL